MRRSWGSLGALLEGLGALLGGSWGGLGRSCGDLKATLGAVQFLIVFLVDFGRQKGAQRGGIPGAKIDPNRSQNDFKFKTIFNSEKVGLQKPLGAVLGRSWVILGVILGSKFVLP